MVLSGRTLAGRALAVATFAFAGLVAPSARAHGSALDADAIRRLEAGETVSFESTVEDGERRYVGGVAYTVVEADAAEINTLLNDPASYRAVLPRTKAVEHVGMAAGDPLLHIRQGNALFEAEYTLRIRPIGNGEGVRFWLEPTAAHGIEDVWGYIRTETLPPRVDAATGDASVHPRVLVTYGILVDVGASLVRNFIEGRLRAALMSVPARFANFAAERHRVIGQSVGGQRPPA